MLYIHLDSSDYKLASVGILQADNITGPYSYVIIIRPGNLESRDLGAYSLGDRGYLVYASGHVNRGIAVARLTPNFTAVEEIESIALKFPCHK